MHQNKISLSPFDSKRSIAEDGIHTHAYEYNPAAKEADLLAAEEYLQIHFLAVSSGTLAASDNFLWPLFPSSNPWGCRRSLSVCCPFTRKDKKSSNEPESCVAQSERAGTHEQ